MHNFYKQLATWDITKTFKLTGGKAGNTMVAH